MRFHSGFSQRPFLRWIGFCLLILVGVSSISYGASVTYDVEEKKPKKRFLIFPYPQHSDEFGWTVGALAVTQGYLQDQLKFFINVYQTGENRGAIEYEIKDFEIPYVGNRWFLDHSGKFGKYPDPDLRGYTDSNLAFTDERAGTNDSDRENFIRSSGTDERFWFRLKYTLPIGNAEASPVKNYVLKDGLLESGASGGTSWNPLKSGVSVGELKYFYRRVKFDFEEDQNFRTNGLEFKLIRDNRDYSTNPSGGSYQSFVVARDFGWGNSDDSWTNWQLDLRKYFSIGKSNWARQRVFAFDFWLADTPTWDETQTSEGTIINNRPPYYMGSRLGGSGRFRGYPSNRYNDRTAVYYAMEYRYIPRWNPLGETKWLKWFDIDWWQFIGFAELGRVASSFDIGDLHSDMKLSGGLGLRLLMQKIIIRFDLAFSEEETGRLIVNVGQTF